MKNISSNLKEGLLVETSKSDKENPRRLLLRSFKQNYAKIEIITKQQDIFGKNQCIDNLRKFTVKYDSEKNNEPIGVIVSSKRFNSSGKKADIDYKKTSVKIPGIFPYSDLLITDCKNNESDNIIYGKPSQSPPEKICVSIKPKIPKKKSKKDKKDTTICKNNEKIPISQFPVNVINDILGPAPKITKNVTTQNVIQFPNCVINPEYNICGMYIGSVQDKSKNSYLQQSIEDEHAKYILSMDRKVRGVKKTKLKKKIDEINYQRSIKDKGGTSEYIRKKIAARVLSNATEDKNEQSQSLHIGSLPHIKNNYNSTNIYSGKTEEDTVKGKNSFNNNSSFDEQQNCMYRLSRRFLGHENLTGLNTQNFKENSYEKNPYQKSKPTKNQKKSTNKGKEFGMQTDDSINDYYKNWFNYPSGKTPRRQIDESPYGDYIDRILKSAEIMPNNTFKQARSKLSSRSKLNNGYAADGSKPQTPKKSYIKRHKEKQKIANFNIRPDIGSTNVRANLFKTLTSWKAGVKDMNESDDLEKFFDSKKMNEDGVQKVDSDEDEDQEKKDVGVFRMSNKLQVPKMNMDVNKVNGHGLVVGNVDTNLLRKNVIGEEFHGSNEFLDIGGFGGS